MSFFRAHCGQPLASSALTNPMSRRFIAALDSFIARDAVPLVLFRKGQRKRLRGFAHEEGVVFIGKAQEKTAVFRTEKRHSPRTGRPYPMDRSASSPATPSPSRLRTMACRAAPIPVPARDLRRPDRRQGRWVVAQLAGPAAAPVHRRRSPRRLPLRPLNPPSRVLVDTDTRSSRSTAACSSSR